MSMLYVRDGNQFQEADSNIILDRAQELISRRVRVGSPVLQRPDQLRAYLQFKLGSLEHEMFSTVFLNSRNRMIEYIELFRGTVDRTTVPVREVVKEALSRNAVSVIFAHNHPSGDPEPSVFDEAITQRLKQSLDLFDIRVLDHIIVAGDQIYSFAEHGLL
jgi:DNA repair protein RadC